MHLSSSRLAISLAAVAAVTLLITTPAPATPARSATLEETVTSAMAGQLRAQSDKVWYGYQYRVSVQRHDSSGGWAFGVAVHRAPNMPGHYPQAWLFLAKKEASGWTVALEDTRAFLDLAAKAPAAVVGTAERATFQAAHEARNDTTIQAVASNNTKLTLPYAVGQSWQLTGGPHGWAGSDTPWSSIDLAGGDGIVRAAGPGQIYKMCPASNPGGWLRIKHPTGYTTDYYHLRNVTSFQDGESVAAGAALGNTGTDICAGGSATGAHVHWTILDGTARVGWHWRSAGRWVFWNGASAYEGYAMHGSTRVNKGGYLYNYGKLGGTKGIVDAYGNGYVNTRSGPGSGFPVVGSVNDGDVVKVVCWRSGTTHTGRYGTTSVWNQLANGQWMSDAFLYTGVYAIGSNC